MSSNERRQVSMSIPIELWDEVRARGMLGDKIQDIFIRLIRKGLAYEDLRNGKQVVLPETPDGVDEPAKDETT